MKTYARYKDSGISWIGEIPEHWEVIPLKRLFQGRKSGAWGDDERKNKSDRICLRIADFDMARLRLKKDAEFTVRNYTEDVISKCFLSNGDILVEKSGGGEKTPVGRAVIYDLKLIEPLFANFMDRLRCYETVNPIYAVYLWNLMYKKGAVWNYVKATTGIQNLDIAALLSFEQATLPPLAEQKSIAAYLDEKTEQINRLVAAKQKQIELLKEYKQSLIANAVTKGINPKVKMKDSGINWIGKVPEHWNIHFLFQKAKEHYISNQNVHHQNLLSLSYGRIIQKDINTTEGLLPESFDTYQIVEDGNIVLRLTDLQNDHKSLRVGYVTQEGIITSAYECLEVMSGYFPKYLYYQLHSFDIKKMFYGMGGGLRQNLNYNELKKIRIAVPPFEEQKAIVEYIENRVSSIDTQISSIEKQIANLNEYKQSLISDVVTGKVKV